MKYLKMVIVYSSEVRIPFLDGREVAERSVAAAATDTAAGRRRTRTETHHVTAISRPAAT